MKVVLILALFAIFFLTESVNGQNKSNKNVKETQPTHTTSKPKPKSGQHETSKRNSPDIFKPNRKKPATTSTQKPAVNHNANKNNVNKKKHNVKKTHNKKPRPPPKQNLKWKPKPNKSRPPPQKGYSGWKPEEWGNNTNIIDENGEMLNRTSQMKFEEYMAEIFGRADVIKDVLLTPEELNGRELADPGEYPHMAAVGIIRDYEDVIDWKCGGSLISRQYVVTAAHCCSFGGEHPTHVELGAIDLRKKTEENEGTIVKEIEEVIIHPYYRDESYYYDIGLLKMVESVIFSFTIRPVQIWPLEYVPYKFAFACGFGATQFGRVQTNVLTEMNLDLIGNQECNQSLPALEETPSGILDNQVCATDLDGIVDTCQGDSGGPLQLNLPSRKRPRHSLIGIVSYGVFCGSTYPGVYTRVYSFLDWIESIVWPRTYSSYNPDAVIDNIFIS